MPTQKMQAAKKQARSYARLRNIALTEFNKNITSDVEQAVNGKSPFKVVYGKGKYFVVFSADEWESEQETLHVLQDTELVRKIGKALRVYPDKIVRKRTLSSAEMLNEGADI